MVVAREAGGGTDPPGRSIGCDSSTTVCFTILCRHIEIMLAVVIGFCGTVCRHRPHEWTQHPGLGIDVPRLHPHAVTRSGQQVSVGKNGEPVLLTLLCDNTAIGIMPLRFHMNVVPPRVVGDMNDAMVESDKQVSCRGPTMSEGHAPCRPLFPAIGVVITEKF